jgi:hypothetical protein
MSDENNENDEKAAKSIIAPALPGQEITRASVSAINELQRTTLTHRGGPKWDTAY